MKPEAVAQQRSQGQCELCAASSPLKLYEVPPQDIPSADTVMMVCDTCLQQIEQKAELDHNHWQCLSTSMWSEVPAVQVVSWRMLNRLRNESWAADLLDMLYLTDEWLAFAKTTGDHESDGTVNLHRDCNGAQLFSGDTVVLTKSLDVKGSTVNARVGTVIRNIRLVPDNVNQIEGRIENQQIVILTQYLRRQHS